jgi:deoxycytidylate deaminase
MIIDPKLIDEAIKIAERSPARKYMTGCVIANSEGDVIATGWSHTGTWRMRELYSVHAEMHALIRSRHLFFASTDQAYIATIARKSGAITLGRPCLSCATALLRSGIGRVNYTVKENLNRSEHINSEMMVCLKVYNRPAYDD